MSALPRYFRLRIRDAVNAADALTVTSVPSGTNPYLSSIPQGDGQEFDPLTGRSIAGAYTGRIADFITSGTSRIVTAQLEDANFRQQLMGRRAFYEWSADGSTWTGGTNGGVLIAGYLSLIRLVTGSEYEITVSDPTRIEDEYTAFQPQSAVFIVAAPGASAGATSVPCQPLVLGIASGTTLVINLVKQVVITADAAAGATSLSVSALANSLVTGEQTTYVESMASFLARWPYRGCILGGPIRNSPFLVQPDRGGWEMTVEKSSSTLLRFNAGYAPPDFKRSTNAQDCMTVANAKTDSLMRSFGYQLFNSVVTVDQAAQGQWRGLVVELVGSGFFQPNNGLSYDSSTAARMTGEMAYHLCKDIRARGIYLTGTSATPSAGTKVRVRAFTAEVSDLSPIYWTGHPVDLLAVLWGEAGLPYSASAITATKQAVGTSRVISLRITEPQPLGSFLERNIYAPFGVGVRTNANGELEAFSARIPYAAVPSTQVTSADVWTDETGQMPELFAIDESSAVRKVTFTHQKIVRTQDARDSNTPDGFVTQEERYERMNSDSSAVGNREIDFAIDGMLHLTDGNNIDISTYVDALALEIFDRWGRGIITGSVQGLRGGSTDSVNLGDELLNVLPQLPNHNKRLVDDNSVSGRAMQILKYTWTPSGPVLKLGDSGPNAQPFATVPTLTIAATSDAPRTVAQVTVTNASTLNTAGAGMRLQVAVTTGAVPASTAYTDVAAFVGGAIPTTAIRLPTVVAGRTVYARAAATLATKRPSSWSTAAGISLTGIPAPSALTVTPSSGDGSRATVAWTAGDTTSLIDIYLRASGAPSSDAVLQRTLREGSTTFVLEALTPGSAYTVGVQARDIGSGDTSSVTESTFTAGATTAALNPPSNPTAFSGSQDPRYGLPQQDGVYGLAVAAEEFPGYTEFQEAVETGVGTGVYGTAVTVATMANVQGDWTLFELVAPNDGLWRQLTARHVRDGATSSSFTAPVRVMPWSAQFLSGFTTTVQRSSILRVTETESTDGTTANLALLVGSAVDHVQAYYRTVPRDQTGDVADFSATAVLPTDGILIARAVSGACSFAFPQPAREKRLVARLVPWYLAQGGVYVEGESVVFPVNPAPPSINVQLHATKVSGTSATLSLDVAVGVSDIPASLAVIETISGVETTILTVGITTNVTLTSGSYPVLGSRSISGVQSASWRAVLTDVSGASWLFGPVTALSDVPSLTAQYKPLTSTTGQVVWTCSAGVASLSIDGGTPSTPSASPIAITLDSNTHNYAFVATLGSQSIPVSVTVPSLSSAGVGSSLAGTFDALTNVLHATGNPGTVDFGWTQHGFAGTVAYNVYVNDVGRFGDAFYHYFATTAAGASSYTYTAGEQLTGTRSTLVDIGFFVEATLANTNGPRSATLDATYGTT